MTFFRFPSIRARMTALFGCGAAVLMAVSGTLLVWNSQREAEGSARNSLSAVRLSLREPLQKNVSLDKIKEILTNHNAKTTRNGPWAAEVEAWLVSPGGALKWKTGPFLPPRRMHRDDSPDDDDFSMAKGHFHDDNEAGAPPPQEGPDDRRGGPHPPRLPEWLRLVAPPQIDGSNWRHIEMKRGKDTLVLGVPWFRNDRALHSQQFTLLGLGLLISAAAAVGAWFLVGKVLSPIEKLASQARGLASEDTFEGRLSATSTDAEMVNLTGTLNDMLTTLGESARSKERFHTAASHELRTPLQALSGHLQLALSRMRSPDEYRLALEEAARQTERLSSLTHDLLMLNQLQMATSKLPFETVDITEIVAQSIDHCTPAVNSRSVQIREDLQPFEIEAATSHIAMLSRNLVENAVKYVKEGGVIDISLRQQTLMIWNETAEQLHDGDLEQLFEPFFRPDASRHSATGGNGLGLSICRAICEANAWAISLLGQEREGKPGVCASVRFVPASPQNSLV